MIPTAGEVPGIMPAELLRALDLLGQQRRRILDLSSLVSVGQRTLQNSTAELLWRSPARLEFDLRLTEIQSALSHGSRVLSAALAECDRARDRARDLVLSRLAAGDCHPARDFVGYAARSTGS
jgi:hypothetical protein